MMRKKNQAFTLIEVLAVILLLSSIMAIIVPAVLERIEKSKQTSAEKTMIMYIDAVERVSVFPDQKETELDLTKRYDVNELNTIIDFDRGEKPNTGFIEFDEDGQVIAATFCISNYKIDFINENASVDQENNCTSIEESSAPTTEYTVNEPQLESNMIPVVYNTVSSSWEKADISSVWYDYDIQNWANAVTVKATGTQTRDYYLTAPSGTLINITDINTMWVWIPKYEYKITGTYGLGGISTASPGEIEVNFISKETSSPTTDYRIHPAFTFGANNLSGIWVGKFENSATSVINYLDGDDVDTKSIVIKPNSNSWRFANLSNMFKAIRKMELYNNAFGFPQATTATSLLDSNLSIANDNNNIDIHLMKNTEWGVVVYLSQSKYGKYGNSNYVGANKEVYINNYRFNTTVGMTISGCSSGFPSAIVSNTCKYTYEKTPGGTGASTTGNISGIYDTNGGANEVVFGALYIEASSGGYPGVSGSSATYNSNFNGFLIDDKLVKTTGMNWPTSEYFDIFTTKVGTTACNGGICYGHAISETSFWYSDSNTFGNTIFITRGGASSTGNSGIFNFDASNGVARIGNGSRTVLVVK